MARRPRGYINMASSLSVNRNHRENNKHIGAGRKRVIGAHIYLMKIGIIILREAPAHIGLLAGLQAELYYSRTAVINARNNERNDGRGARRLKHNSALLAAALMSAPSLRGGCSGRAIF